MKKVITIIAAFSGLVLFNSCHKEAPEPELNPIESSSLVRGTCRNYWFYDGSQPQSLGNPDDTKIRIGFKKGTNQAKQFQIISAYPQLSTIINPAQYVNETKVDVSLDPNLTCADIGDLLDELVLNNHIDYANPYFFSNTFGFDDFILVELAPEATMPQLHNLIKSSKTEYVNNLFGNVHIVKITKHSPKNCLETSIQFYDSGLCTAAYPEWHIYPAN